MLTLYGTGKEEHFGGGCVCLKTKDSEFLFCFVFFFLPTLFSFQHLLYLLVSISERMGGGETTTRFGWDLCSTCKIPPLTVGIVS